MTPRRPAAPALRPARKLEARHENTTYTVRADARQSARWRRKAEAEGYAGVEQWAVFALDAYLELGAKMGTAERMVWRSGSFPIHRTEGEAVKVTGLLSPPFGIFAETESTLDRATRPAYCLTYLPEGRILATFRTCKDCKRLAEELVRTARLGSRIR